MVVESEVWGAAESGSGWDADLIIVVVVVVVVFLVVVVVRREAFSRVPALGPVLSCPLRVAISLSEFPVEILVRTLTP